MRWVRKLRLRFRSLFDRFRVENDLEDELGDYLDRETEREIAAGCSPEEARRLAIRGLHGTVRLKEECRDARGVRWLEEILSDLRFAFRTLRRAPGFSVVAILTFALGAGANALMFTVIDSVLLRPLPYPDSHQLVFIDSTQADGSRGSTSLPNFLDMRTQSWSFSAMAAYEEKSASLRLPSGEPVHSAGVAASAAFFDVLRVRPMLGRPFFGRGRAAR